jgi:predicted RNA-binding Zn ribbon-like protein
MAERPPAPQPLELVRIFVNTLDVETGEDELAGASGAERWLRDHDLLGEREHVSPADRRRVIETREALRALLLGNNGVPLPRAAVNALNAVAQHIPLTARFDRAGTIGVAGTTRGVDGALGRLLAIVLGAVADGTWSRLKVCREDECQWAFYDRSRNRSGQWCVMAVCGNRNKARSYRERQRSR